MDDYYALLGVLRSSRLVSHTHRRAGRRTPRPLQRLRELKAELRKETRAGPGSATPASSPATCGRPQAKRAKRPDAAELATGLDAAPARTLGRGPDGRDSCRWTTRSSPGASLSAPGEAGVLRGVADAGGAVREGGPRAGRVQPDAVRHLRRLPRRRRRGLAGRRPGAATGRRAGAATSCSTPTGTPSSGPSCPPAASRTPLSDKLNGTLRSPVLPPGKAYISFQVAGPAQQRGAAGLEQLPAQLQELPRPDVGRPALGHLLAARRPRRPADLRRADDDVRQPEVPRPAQRPGRRPGELPAALGEGRRRTRVRTSASPASCCTTPPSRRSRS